MQSRWTAIVAALILCLRPPTAQADPKWDAETKRINGHFQTLDNHIKKSNWNHPRTEGTAKTYMKRLLSAITLAEKRYPAQSAITARMKVGAQKMAQAVMAKMQAAKAAKAAAKAAPKKTGPKSVGDDLSEAEAVAFAGFYEPAYQAAKNIPARLDAAFFARSAKQLEAFDLPAVEAQMKKDRTRLPELFKYYGMEDKRGRYGDLPYGGKSKPLVKQAKLKQLHQYYVPMIHEAKAKLAGTEPQMVSGVKKAIAAAKTLDEAILALRVARACAHLKPGHAGIAASVTEAEAAVAAKTSAISHLVTGPFHTKNFKRIVAFSSPQKLGAEDPAAIVHKLVPGKPLYLKGYLSQSVESLGATRRDSQLGYEVPVNPDLYFKHGPAYQLRLKLRTKNAGVKGALKKVGVIEIPLLPDPDKADFASHFDYLPSLHFAKWLSRLAPGAYELQLGLTGSVELNPDRPGAFAKLPIEVTAASKAALADYTARLWKKKLAAVTFPDTFGIEDRKTDIPNVSKLAKYGKLHRLSAAQTNKVMKPFPLQHQIKNFVGQGFGVFEKDGRYSVIGLGYSRTPEQPKLLWTSLTGTPDHYAISDGKNTIDPELYNHGYEILPENIQKTGEW